MKKTVCCVVLISGLTHAGLAGDMRTWESVSGASIEAKLDKVFGGEAYLKKSDGKTLRIGVNKLSEKDRAYIVASSSQPSAGTGDMPNQRADQAIVDLLGETLEDAKGRDVSVHELAGKKIGLYFSAHWCPPCRAFTPRLVDAYNKADSDDVELILVSSDRSGKDMRNYMKETDMPWLALPFAGDKIGEVKKRYNVRGIPTLIFIDENGVTITRDGRTRVSREGASAIEHL